jgi:hypothetical protein
MKRDWDVIRQVLEEIEAMEPNARTYFSYASFNDPIKADHVELLRKAGFLTGKRDGSLRDVIITGADLTWAGHDLLDTIRSKGIWNKITTTAKAKGIELTFDAVKALGKYALEEALKG